MPAPLLPPPAKLLRPPPSSNYMLRSSLHEQAPPGLLPTPASSVAPPSWPWRPWPRPRRRHPDSLRRPSAYVVPEHGQARRLCRRLCDGAVGEEAGKDLQSSPVSPVRLQPTFRASSPRYADRSIYPCPLIYCSSTPTFGSNQDLFYVGTLCSVLCCQLM